MYWHIELFDGGRSQAAIGIQSVAALEVFDRIHQRPTVGLPVGGESGIHRQVTHDPQKTDQAWHPRVGLGWINRLRYSWECFAIIGPCQFDIASECLLGPAISDKWRLLVIQDCLQVPSRQYSFAQKLAEVVFLPFCAQSEAEMLRIGPSDS